MIGGFVGVSDLVRLIPLTASRNKAGGAKESSGPTRGTGKNDLVSADRNDLPSSTNEQVPTGVDSPITAASLASSAASRR